jgi:heme-degrading monooxygenase HmoA
LTIEFCVIYRWKLAPGMEKQFIAAWQTMTEQIREHASRGCRCGRAI